jgi:N-acetylglucosaminyl-diphospho-decaprenol L-rhamnosyltransferase
MGRVAASWPRYVLLLNPDTVVPPGVLAAMVAFMDANPEAGAAGPKLVRFDGSLDLACRRSFPSPEVSLYRMLGLSRLFPHHRRLASYNLTYLSPDDIYEVDSVVGAFMMVRTSALYTVGLLDEEFFMYGEDLDWAYRMKNEGWKVLYNGQVQVFHHKGASSRKRSTKSVFAFYRSMLVFYRKHYYRSTARPISWLVIAGIYLGGALALVQNQLRLSARRTS